MLILATTSMLLAGVALRWRREMRSRIKTAEVLAIAARCARRDSVARQREAELAAQELRRELDHVREQLDAAKAMAREALWMIWSGARPPATRRRGIGRRSRRSPTGTASREGSQSRCSSESRRRKRGRRGRIENVAALSSGGCRGHRAGQPGSPPADPGPAPPRRERRGPRGSAGAGAGRRVGAVMGSRDHLVRREEAVRSAVAANAAVAVGDI